MLDTALLLAILLVLFLRWAWDLGWLAAVARWWARDFRPMTRMRKRWKRWTYRPTGRQ